MFRLVTLSNIRRRHLQLCLFCLQGIGGVKGAHGDMGPSGKNVRLVSYGVYSLLIVENRNSRVEGQKTLCGSIARSNGPKIYHISNRP